MKVLYVSTLSNTINRFMIPHIELLLNQGHHVDIACNIDREIDPKLIERGCKVFNIEFQRSPLTKQNFIAYSKLKQLIQDKKYDIVHTHTPIASTCVRLACRRMSDVKVFYTAHGFHFFKGAPLKNWLIYYPIERYLARYTDVLITINNEDYTRARKSFKAGRIGYIPGVGLDINKFKNATVDRAIKLKEIDVPDSGFVILSVGELNNNKNHETIIKSLAKLDNNNAYYVICGQGPKEYYLKDLASKLGIEKQVKLLGRRSDIAEICKVSDIFAFPSKREGLGLAALEGMASGLPIITSNVHGIVDYSINRVTGFSCSPTNVDEFSKAILSLMNDSELRNKIGNYNIGAVEKYDIKNSLHELYKLYLEELG